MKSVFYYGRWSKQDPGHFLYTKEGIRARRMDMPDDFPCILSVLDGGLLPPYLPALEGLATVAHFNGWTVISFWDNSADERSGSSSTFIIKGTHDLQKACTIFFEHFPSIWNRMKFPIKIR